MRFDTVFPIFVAVVCFLALASAAPPIYYTQSKEQPLDLSIGGWDQISDIEHTAEYLEMTGGAIPSGYDANAPNIAGSWLFELRDGNTRPLGKIDLNLYQAGVAIWGMGNLTQGLSSQPVVVQGSISEGSMYVGVVALGDLSHYRITMNSPITGSTSGSFEAFTIEGTGMTGTVSGGRNEPRTFTPFAYSGATGGAAMASA